MTSELILSSCIIEWVSRYVMVHLKVDHENYSDSGRYKVADGDDDDN